MPETPDFDQIARQLALDTGETLALVRKIVEQLRQVWNARGAADIAKLDVELSMLDGQPGRRPCT